MKVLVIGGETPVVERVRRDLQRAEYEVESESGERGLERALQNRYALVVVDMGMPGIDARRFCETLRAQRQPPAVVMLTNSHDCADIYLSQRYETEDFLADVRALLWKQEGRHLHTVQVGDLTIDTARHSVTRAGVEIDLSLREYSLLEALVLNAGRILTREAIQEKVWQNEEAVSKTVDVYIGRLRRRVDAAHPVKLIRTIRGLGYSLRSNET